MAILASRRIRALISHCRCCRTVCRSQEDIIHSPITPSLLNNLYLPSSIYRLMCNTIHRTYKCKHVHTEVARCAAPVPCRTATVALQVHAAAQPCNSCAPAYAKWAQLQLQSGNGADRLRMAREQEEERLLGEKYRGLFEPDQPGAIMAGR